MSNLKYVVFDCDGVLFDSKGANQQYYNTMLRQFGHPDMSARELEFVHTHSAGISVEHIFSRYSDNMEDVEKFRKELDYSPYLKFMVMEPGLKEFLADIRKNLRTAISTNRTTTMGAVLEMSGLGELFDIVVTALDVKHPKPHPEALLKILDYFGYGVEEGIFIGDSEVDREHAASLGMKMIAFKNPELDSDYHADSFRAVAQLPMFLNR